MFDLKYDFSLQNAPNQFFGADLECYAYYKSLRDYRLVEDNTHCPPWCLTLLCKGRIIGFLSPKHHKIELGKDL